VRRANRGEAGMATDAGRIDTIQQLIQCSPDGLDNLDHICYQHLKAVGGHCGLQLKVLKRFGLQLRIQALHQRQGDLNSLRTGPDTHTWFRQADRPAVPSDRLGIYSTVAIDSLKLVPTTDALAERLVGEIASDARAWSLWLEEGSLNVRGLFSWLFTGIEMDGEFEAGVGPYIEEEFLMYEHHQREINGKPNRGWLRTMLYSLTQQLIRQDLEYYVLYVAMRPDHCPRLVSYPYYTKFARPGDATYFRHIDINIPEFLETGRGGNIIQGSASLDDETAETGCTVIIPGMHKRLGEWWRDVISRSDCESVRGTTGRVHNVQPLWHAGDAAKYGHWTPVPCSRGDVRITKPELVHGSTDTTAIRRTVLPWYVGLRSDGKTLDTVESGTWDQLCLAHARQEAPFSSPSGHPNLYGAIPHRFAAATKLNLDSAVSQALVCGRRWDDPAVIHEANLLLGPDRAAARRRINSVRIQGLRMFKARYREQAEAERVCFGPASYWEMKGRGELDPRSGRGAADVQRDRDGEEHFGLDSDVEG
jgi:hypothetical protein